QALLSRQEAYLLEFSFSFFYEFDIINFCLGRKLSPLLYLSFQQFTILYRMSSQIFIFAKVPPFFLRWDSGRTGCTTLCRASNLPPYFSRVKLLSKLIIISSRSHK